MSNEKKGDPAVFLTSLRGEKIALMSPSVILHRLLWGGCHSAGGVTLKIRTDGDGLNLEPASIKGASDI